MGLVGNFVDAHRISKLFYFEITQIGITDVSLTLPGQQRYQILVNIVPLLSGYTIGLLVH